MEVNKTLRLLTIYCFFTGCEEVEYRAITDSIPVSKKTIQRDLQFLEQAGLIRFTFDRQLKAFIPQSAKDAQPVFPEKEIQRRHMEKIIRLCYIISHIDGEEDPIGWYHENFPHLSERTRQRDFKLLNELGVEIVYYAADYWADGEPGHWSCNYYGPFTLKTLK